MTLMLSILLLTNSALGEGEVTEEFGTGDEHEEHSYTAVLYAPLILTLGVMVYYLQSRFFHWLPYTAIMFLLGVVLALVANSQVLEMGNHNHVFHDTIFAWQKIDSEVLLLVFLPGLIFKDALSQNPYLFFKGFGQLLIFALPMVLAGTLLTACVPYFLFDYDWPFVLCMTFGSILSATDPVAVAALLEEVGAPPRLTTHIAGESLLNDGAAIVFFAIFSKYYFSNIEGLEENIDVGNIVKDFAQKAFGGCAIGIVAGGAIVLVMSKLNRRFGKEENIVQVTAVLSMVYLIYFIAEIICHTSGLIATVAAGLCMKTFGRSAINDIHLMNEFFSITEYILNTTLFSLGGLVWGELLYRNFQLIEAKDFGYLLILYVLLHVIRALLFAAAYPITVRIGLKTNWKETSFQIYGGLRGAVGIALALSLDNDLNDYNKDDFEKARNDVFKVYFMVGAIAFLTLFINGSTAGPYLKRLGLVESSVTREKLIEAYRVQMRAKVIDSFVKLLTHERFKSINFSFVQKSIPFLSDLTIEQLVEAVEKMKESTKSKTYRPPYLQNVLAVLGDEEDWTSEEGIYDILKETPEKNARMQKIARRMRGRSSMVQMMTSDPLSTQELRLLFISMLRAQYECLINEGLLTSQHRLTVAIEQSLELAKTEVNDGMKLNDLCHLKKLNTFERISTRWLGWKGKESSEEADLRSLILLEFTFINAHEVAQENFQEQLGDGDSDLSEGAKIVLGESKAQVEAVRQDLNSKDLEGIVTEVSTHKLCDILLNRGIAYVSNLVESGLLKESEAEEITRELAQVLKTAGSAKIDSAKSDTCGMPNIIDEENEVTS